MSTFASHCRHCHSPTWQECCPGTPVCVFSCSSFVRICSTSSCCVGFNLDIWFFFYSFYNTKSVVLCLGITAAVCLLVTIFSFQTKVSKSFLYWLDFHAVPHHTNVWCHPFVQFDVTSYQGVLFIFCMVLFISGIVLALILPFQYVSITLESTLAAFCSFNLKLFSSLGTLAGYRLCCHGGNTLYHGKNATIKPSQMKMYHWYIKYSNSVCFILCLKFLAFDTQLLMGNKRYTISPEEYVFATLNIYLDIIYIFSFFLQIFGTRRD